MIDNINNHDHGLIDFPILEKMTPSTKLEYTQKLKQKVRIDYFKLALPEARFLTQGNISELKAYICSTLINENIEDVFTGEPFLNYSGINFNNDLWHFSSAKLVLRNPFTDYHSPQTRIVKAPLELNLNFSRFYAHAQCENGAFLLPETVLQGNAVGLMRLQRRVTRKLRLLSLDDSDNFLSGERYIGTGATVACVRHYLEKVLGFLEQVYGQRHSETELISATSNYRNNLSRYLRQNEVIGFVDRRKFKINKAEFYIDFKHPDAVEKVKLIGMVLKRIGREIHEDGYTGTIGKAHNIKDMGHCYSYRASLNSGRQLKVYAKTPTRIRIEILFQGSIRNHIKNITSTTPLDEMVQLFTRGIDIAAEDIYSFIQELAQHSPYIKYKHCVSPYIFSNFITTMHNATDGNMNHIQKIISELLDRNSVRTSKDDDFNNALKSLQCAGILKRVGIEKRISKPVYIITEHYYPIVFHLVKTAKKVTLTKQNRKS